MWTSRRVVVAVIACASTVRLAYGLLIVDPLSGPDAATYLAAAEALHTHGLASSGIPGIPYWPAGYPIFLSLLFRLPGPNLGTVVLAQTLLLALATYLLYTLVAREWSTPAAVLAVVMLSLSPALVAAPGLLMYEPVLLSGLVVGADLLSRAAPAERARGLGHAAVGSGVIGLTSMLQQRVLLAGVFAIGWLVHRRRIAVLAVVAIVALSVGPILLGVRTLAAEGRFALAGNTGVTMAIGFNPDATGGYIAASPRPPDCEHRDDWVLRDRELIRCSLLWAVQHPVASARLTVSKAARFWGPMTGSRSRGTWFHAFDYRRALPAGVRSSRWFEPADHALSVAWTAATLVLALAGLVLALRHPAWRSGAVLFGLLVAAFLLTTLVSIGDARFRLPVAPFSVAFQALAVVWLAQVMRERRSAR